MGSARSSRQRRAADELFDIVFDASRNGTPQVFERLLGPITELTQSDFSGWHRIGLAAPQVRTVLWPDPAMEARAEEHMRERLDTHALLAHYAQRRSMDVLDVRDVSRLAVWRRSLAYNVIRAEFGVREHMAIPVAYVEGSFLVYAIGKEQRAYEQQERDIADWVQRVLLRFSAHHRSALGAAPQMISANSLTPRELAVLNALSSGETRGAAARALSISPRTLDKHVENVFAKLGVNSLVAALGVLGRDIGDGLSLANGEQIHPTVRSDTARPASVTNSNRSR